MLGRTYERENCSAARALEVAGERWSLLMLRDAMFRGRRRFGEFTSGLGMATNVAAARLERFVAEGLMEPRPQPGQPERHEYTLTDKGFDFATTLVALTAWGDKWSAPKGPPVTYLHQACGQPVVAELRCARCAQVVGPREILARPGPGSRQGPSTQ